MGRSNLLGGKVLADCLKANIQLFGRTMLECLEYFTDGKILSADDMKPYTEADVLMKIEALKEILA